MRRRLAASWNGLWFRPPEADTPAGRAQERKRRAALSALTGLGARAIGTVTMLVTVPLTLRYRLASFSGQRGGGACFGRLCLLVFAG